MDERLCRTGHPDLFKLAEQGTLIGIRQEQHEFIPSEPCERRRVGEHLSGKFCELPQDHISGGVAERIIDAFEAIHVDERQPKPLPFLFLHPPQLIGQHLTETAAVPEGRERINIGKLTQHEGVFLQAAEHDVEHGPQFRDFVMPADGNGRFRFAFRDPVREQRSLTERLAHLPHPVPDPHERDEEYNRYGSSQLLHMVYDRTLVRFDLMGLPFKDAGDPRLDKLDDLFSPFLVGGIKKKAAGILHIDCVRSAVQTVRAQGFSLARLHGLDLRNRQIVGATQGGRQKRHVSPAGSIALQQRRKADRLSRRKGALPGHPPGPLRKDVVIRPLGSLIARIDVFPRLAGQIIGTLEQFPADLHQVQVLDVGLNHFRERAVHIP